MTPEERAEARRLVDEANLWSDTSVEWADFASQAKRLIPRLLDALEAAERERDFADAFHKTAVADRNLAWNERDTARAQVETLAEALREIIANTRCAGPGSCNSYGICAACTSESFARTALKAAGVEA